MINYPSDWTKINPQIPFIGAWSKKATYIEKMWAQPCGPSPTLMVLGAFAALPELVFALLQPDCLDHAFDRVGKCKGRRRKPGINVADHMTPLVAPKGTFGWVMFTGAKLAQRAGFYALMVDSYLDWVIAGTSLAFQWNGCDDPNQGHATSNMNAITAALMPAGDFQINTWHVQSHHIFVADGVSIVTPAGHEAGAGFSLTQIPNVFPGLPDCSFTARLVDVATGWDGPTVEQYVDTNNRMSATFGNGIPRHNAGGHNFRVRCTKTFGVMVVDGQFTAGGLNLKAFKPTMCGHSTKSFD